MKAGKIVKAVKNRVMMPIPQKKQKDLKAGSSVVHPKRKAIELVKEVIVMD